ncbi:MAG: GNAT family N-acetyltransferase [Ardenticatenales bacterium]|nr:GNAT family N-acetyltransferase [Ardenticatenales bacterium]
MILRRATPADAEPLAKFNAEMHINPGEEPNEAIAQWTRDLMAGTHPTFPPEDFMVVEDTRNGAIVSALNHISQRWSYGSIEFAVGRPELVATHPDYRRRGLVRAQMEMSHQWSVERGEVLQVITGIPWYYRQFGYEMGLEHAGYRAGYLPHIPKLEESQEESYHIRPATQDDLSFIAECYKRGMGRYLLSTVRDDALWEYELQGRSPISEPTVHLCVIEKDGEVVGLLAHQLRLWGPTLSVRAYELKPGISWLAVTPTVLRYLKKTGEAYHAEEGKEPFGAFIFFLGTEHPVYQAIPELLPRKRDPYAYYVRVPDVPGFLRLITPVLEQRLAESVAVGHTGELLLNFYRSGVRLVLEQGKLTAIEPWQPMPDDIGHAGFPDLSFLQLLFGYRSMEELRHFYADCWAEGDNFVLLSILYPKQPSYTWAIS